LVNVGQEHLALQFPQRIVLRFRQLPSQRPIRPSNQRVDRLHSLLLNPAINLQAILRESLLSIRRQNLPHSLLEIRRYSQRLNHHAIHPLSRRASPHVNRHVVQVYSRQYSPQRSLRLNRVLSRLINHQVFLLPSPIRIRLCSLQRSQLRSRVPNLPQCHQIIRQAGPLTNQHVNQVGSRQIARLCNRLNSQVLSRQCSQAHSPQLCLV